ncbi:AAA family ATPase [Anaerosolibacter sp.]|uniref:AAA family ATPase n=1 Tax=Anaerosolibacter sp. TaxID=1872527 RepID=UPI0039EE262A
MDELIRKLEQYIEASGDSQSATAKKIGISPTALSQLLKGKYPNPQTLEKKITEFLDISEQESQIIKRPEFVMTSISKTVLDTISYCHIQKAIGLVYGDAGIGKSEAVKQYEREYSEAIVIRVSKAFTREKSLLKILARKLRVAENKKIEDLYMDCIERLDGSGKLLIIDEAQRLPHSTIELLRDLHDDAQVGVVFIGNHQVYSKMHGKGEAAFAQIFSRVGIRKCVLTSHVKIEDIQMLFPEYDEEKEAELKVLHQIAQTKWGIRGAVNLYTNACNNGDTSYKGIVGMAKYMGIGSN